MGGRPITALSIVGFPVHAVPGEALHQILRGGIDKMAEAGVAVVGGHSIHDNEIKAGFAVTGLIHPKRIFSNAGALPGDRLILTKPLGTGILAFAAQIGRAPAEWLEAAARSMAVLNRTASEAMIDCDGVHACTDVTGFGLIGHLGAMAAAGKVDVEIVWDDLPLLPGVLQCLAEGIASGAVERNRESSGHCLAADENIEPAMLDLCFDPQTSGGLLIAVAESAAKRIARSTARNRDRRSRGHRQNRRSGHGPRLFAYRRKLGSKLRKTGFPGTWNPILPIHQKQPINQEAGKMACCESNHGSAAPAAATSGVAAEVQKKFQEFLQAAGSPGALDAKTKKAIAIALSVMARCEPCVQSHVAKAREMGFTQKEIDEAAWLAISFGGSPTMVFYNGVRK